MIKIDDAFYEKSSGLKSIQRKIEKFFNSKTLRTANKIFVANQNTKNEVKKFYNLSEKKIFIMPNGIETEKFFSTKSNKKIIIFSGVMYYHRGLDILFDALPDVINQISQCGINIIRRWSRNEKITRYCKKKKIRKKY